MKTKEKYVSKQLAILGYNHMLEAKTDLVATLRLYTALSPSVESYVFQTGQVTQLLNVAGTIPIQYKEKTYHIPLKVWLPLDYPEAAPLCYVVPTTDMELAVSPYLDHSGLVELPCLQEWNHDTTDLTTFLQIARVTFTETPPVFSKPRPGARRKPSKEWESVWDEHFPDEEEKMLKSFFLTSASETCRAKLGEDYNRTQAEVDSLHSVNRELIDRQEELEGLTRKLELAELEATTDLAVVRHGHDSLEAVAAARKVEEAVTVDTVEDLVVVDNARDRQMVAAVAEDETLRDCVLVLGRVLREGRISTDEYLRKVRALSRLQFIAVHTVNTLMEIGEKEKEKAT